ncbi:RNA-binding motif protein 25 isoform X3 [Physcomitrium patens]|nr:RNA-binding protein 25-like isoform X3 [Physcomitrium patens]XP_024365356.1 RNA-binding protein 25-like isoform X3 [Physcomitrium patens]XP_024365357.1 RNA-binding protein 25-like isoform X3 [Physcomitrium patens]PNR27387.1 hypothetical protein PHYPA_029539 [Physcomitrium patens]|eukprot:XP_024365355.1 RNA-binding protein 25-like isoform X3 [Physcomitrella patens]
MVRPPVFPARPPVGPPPVIMLARPPGTGIRPMPPVLKPLPGMLLNDLGAKGVGQIVAPPEKPHTTVYVGKISSTVEDDFLRATLELCGGIKSWKRAQDPTTGSPKGFGFCEFESAEGVLRALRLLNKYSLDGQELVLNVNQATREYLERYVAKKKERERIALEEEAANREEEAAPGVEVVPEPKKAINGVNSKKDENTPEDDAKKFGLVTDADKEVDDQAVQKLNAMLAERAKARPLPPPPPLATPVETSVKSSSVADGSTLLKDGDSTADGEKSENVSGRNDDDTISEQKQSSADVEASSVDRSRRSERGSERDRERELERDKEREVERYERERERERLRRDRDRENRVREAERLYEEREREWESRERDKERQRLYEKEREKDRERERRRVIKEQEEESDDEDRRKPRYRSAAYDEKRKRRHREYEEDEADRIRELEEEASAELVKRHKPSPEHAVVANDENDMDVGDKPVPSIDYVEEPVLLPASPAHVVSMFDSDSEEEEEADHKKTAGNGVYSVGREDSSAAAVTDVKPSSSPAPRKLGFGLMGSGRRTAVPSVFTEEDEDATADASKLRTLVPIDYSAEEMQVVATVPSAPAPPPASGGLAHNLAAAAEFAKSLSLSSGKDENDKDGSRRSRDRTSDRDRSRKEKERDRDRDRDRERDREKEKDRDRDREKDKERERERERERSSKAETKAPESKKILDAKQLIDTIPKTKEELFNFPVDWNIYDSHDLHERMRPWISKKITEFLGEEENTLVDFIVSSTRKHVSAATMLELLEAILDDEAEMFVLKMWRMLIFEVRRVETGLASWRNKSQG